MLTGEEIRAALTAFAARCAAYGWPRSIAADPDETNARLLALNQEIAAGKRPYDPFGHLREPESETS